LSGEAELERIETIAKNNKLIQMQKVLKVVCSYFTAFLVGKCPLAAKVCNNT